MTEKTLFQANVYYEEITRIKSAILETKSIIAEGSKTLANPAALHPLNKERREKYNQELLQFFEECLKELEADFKNL